ncbi:MAG: FecR domain-containing protein [Alphaproteobacteria bacterium]|nr:FecR domain-containing protein [Alphaproteobacteria bacterium]
MRPFIRKTVVFAAVAALTLQPVLAQAQVAIGNANKIIAAVRGVLQANTRTLVLKDEVFSSEKVNTDANSAARFIFRDNTILSIGANSSVTLDRFVFDSDASKSQVAMSMSRGVMRFVSGNLPKNSVFHPHADGVDRY